MVLMVVAGGVGVRISDAVGAPAGVVAARSFQALEHRFGSYCATAVEVRGCAVLLYAIVGWIILKVGG